MKYRPRYMKYRPRSPLHDRDFLLFQLLDVGFPSLCRNCFVVNLSSLVRRLQRSFCQRANRVIELEYASVELYDVRILYMEGRALPEAIENALRALFCEKNGFNMGVNGRGLGRFSFRPKSPQKGWGHLKHDF